MRKLIIIYGSPRTGTTFLHDALLSHPKIKGGHSRSQTLLRTSENPSISPEIGNSDAIDVLYNHYVTDESQYLVLKAPGYFMLWDYFNSIPYECKYIRTNRDPIHVVDSSVRMKSSSATLGAGIDSVHCPDRDRYRDVWDSVKDRGEEEKLIVRSFLRWHWHTNYVPKEMAEVSLFLERYEDRLKAESTIKINEYLDIEESFLLNNALSKFYIREIPEKRQEYILDVLEKAELLFDLYLLERTT